jgi:hypothetical protein
VAVADVKFAARTRDMSRAGLCLVAEQPIARDTEISLQLVLTFGDAGATEPLKMIGQVAWCTALFGSYQDAISQTLTKVGGNTLSQASTFVQSSFVNEIVSLLHGLVHVRTGDVRQPVWRIAVARWKLHHAAERHAVARPHRVRCRPWELLRPPSRHAGVERRRRGRVSGHQIEPDKSSQRLGFRHTADPSPSVS